VLLSKETAMFVGHLSPALAAKPRARDVNLGC
jgi:hypothetical protein